MFSPDGLVRSTHVDTYAHFAWRLGFGYNSRIYPWCWSCCFLSRWHHVRRPSWFAYAHETEHASAGLLVVLFCLCAVWLVCHLTCLDLGRGQLRCHLIEMSCLLALGRLSDHRHRGLVLWAWVSVKSSSLELVFHDQVQHIRSESTSNTHYGARLETVQLHWRSIGFHTLKLLCWIFQAVVLDTVCYSLLETIGLLLR